MVWQLGQYWSSPLSYYYNRIGFFWKMHDGIRSQIVFTIKVLCEKLLWQPALAVQMEWLLSYHWSYQKHCMSWLLSTMTINHSIYSVVHLLLLIMIPVIMGDHYNSVWKRCKNLPRQMWTKIRIMQNNSSWLNQQGIGTIKRALNETSKIFI